MYHWHEGSPDSQIPRPPVGPPCTPSTTSEQYIIASSSSIPEQYNIASSSSIHQQQPDVVGSWVDLNHTIAGDEFASMPVSSNPNLTPHAFPSGDPDEQSGGPIVPAILPVMMPQTSQDDFDKFLDASYKRGFPNSAYEMMWPKVNAHAHPKEITRVMELNKSHIDWEFLHTHKINHNWKRQLAPMCIHIDSFCNSTGGYCSKMLNHLGACILMMLKHHRIWLVAHA